LETEQRNGVGKVGCGFHLENGGEVKETGKKQARGDVTVPPSSMCRKAEKTSRRQGSQGSQKVQVNRG